MKCSKRAFAWPRSRFIPRHDDAAKFTSIGIVVKRGRRGHGLIVTVFVFCFLCSRPRASDFTTKDQLRGLTICIAFDTRDRMDATQPRSHIGSLCQTGVLTAAVYAACSRLVPPRTEIMPRNIEKIGYKLIYRRV